MLLLKNLLFTVFVPGTVAGYVPWRLTRFESTASGLPLVIAFGLFAIGAAIYTWCVWDFAFYGRGTPAPIDQPKKLVIRGLYRYIRNPMYTGVLTVILGWALLYRSVEVLVYAFAAAVFFHLFAILYEEPHLQRVFGDQYEDYRKRVGRWLPKWKKRKQS